MNRKQNTLFSAAYAPMWLLPTLVLGSACGQNGSEAVIIDEPGASTQVHQKEAWTSRDNPSLFTANLEMKLEALPMNGEAANIPWAGSYWPTHEDSINFVWGGTDSPSLKYEKAFGGTGIEDKVSQMRGIDSATSQKECSDSSECVSDIGESLTCAKRRGKDKGRCIATWWGICHAWTPAAILFPEPKNAVVRNGVTFEVQDLKALASLVHDGAAAKSISLRCNKSESASDGGLRYDEFGRPSNDNAECRDTNAGTYHVLLANYLGKMRQSFAEDRTLNYEVWNQPLRSYRVIEKRAVSLDEAHRLIGVPDVSTTPTTRQYTGDVAVGAWFHAPALTVRAGQTVTVKLTGTGDADLYVRYGEQPTSSLYNCRPYVDGNSNEQCQLTVPLGTSSVYVSVFGHTAVTGYTLEVSLGAPPADGGYVFNAQARQFFFLRTEVSYIGESASYVGYIGPSIGSYTHTDNYEYVLELDAAGKIIGGEWVGYSKRAHPDFLWLPTGAGAQTVAGGAISYQSVKSMVMESAGQGTTDAGTGAIGQVVRTENASVAAGEWKNFGPYPTGAGAFTVTMSGTGDADLHTRLGAAPNATIYDCRPYADGSNESCTGQGPGGLYIGVQGYTASTFTLTVSYQGVVVGNGDAGRADAGSFDAGRPDAGNFDAGRPDAGNSDGGSFDAGRPDAGNFDAGRPDAGNFDAGRPDAGNLDGGSFDAGRPDAGNFDAGISTPDAGASVAHLNVSGSLNVGQWETFTLAIPAGRRIVVRTTGTGDADLYVRLGSAPTVAISDGQSEGDTAVEQLTYVAPSTGTLYISVYGYTASTFTLKTSDN